VNSIAVAHGLRHNPDLQVTKPLHLFLCLGRQPARPITERIV
jgi:hypothetical protein